MNEKPAFIFDTNFIIQKGALDDVVSNLQDQFTVYITQISIDERIARLCREQRRRYEKLSEFGEEYADIAEIKIKISSEERLAHYQKGMQRKYEKLFGNSNIIPFTPSQAVFEQVLARIHQKLPPFVDGNSDKGFMDTLLWLSILSFFKENGNNRVVFLTDDNGFQNSVDILCKEFQSTTGKLIEIRRNSYYNELISGSKEMMPSPAPTPLPDFSELRDEIYEKVYAICSVDLENYFGDPYSENTFYLNKEVDAEYVKTAFDRLAGIVNEHIFDMMIPANLAFDLDDRVINGNANIPTKALENVIKLFAKIKAQYPSYLDQFYGTVARIFNQYYRYEQPSDDGELPF